VNVAAGIAYIFVDICQEGDHVVADFGFNFEDSFGVKISLCFDFFDCGGGDVAEFGLSFADSDFYLQPAFQFGGFSPDVAHFGQGVALYHGGSFGECDRPIVPLRGTRHPSSVGMGNLNGYLPVAVLGKGDDSIFSIKAYLTPNWCKKNTP